MMTKYKFERMDFEALMMMLNVLFVIAWNKGAYIGLPVAIICFIWDILDKTHINCAILHLSLVVMNTYFLSLM